jgi:hypothetical protein
VVWREDDELDVKSEEHVVRSEWIGVDERKMKEERAVRVDISRDGGEGLEFGKETLMVNASIMTLRYKPHQSPFLIDLDLERADSLGGDSDVSMGMD